MSAKGKKKSIYDESQSLQIVTREFMIEEVAKFFSVSPDAIGIVVHGRSHTRKFLVRDVPDNEPEKK